MSLFRRIDDWLHPELTIPTRREVSEPESSSTAVGRRLPSEQADEVPRTSSPAPVLARDQQGGSGSLTPSPDDAPVREIAGYVSNGEASVVTTRGVVIPIHTAPRDWTVAQLVWLLAEIDALPEVEP